MLSSDLIAGHRRNRGGLRGDRKWSPAAVRIACQHLERFSKQRSALPLLAASKRSKHARACRYRGPDAGRSPSA